MRNITICIGFALLAWSSPAEAQFQFDEDFWGVSASFTPTWKSPREFRFLIGAEDLDLQGSEFRIGVVRGRVLDGEWGLSFVSQTIDEGSTVDLVKNFPDEASFVCPAGSPASGSCGVSYTTGSMTKLYGIEAHRFIPFATFSDRVQVGMNIAGGAGWYRETVTRRLRDPNPAIPDDIMIVQASELTLPRDSNTPVPIFKVEVAAAGIVGPNLKVRASGGFGFPGNQLLSLSVVYFFGS